MRGNMGKNFYGTVIIFLLGYFFAGIVSASADVINDQGFQRVIQNMADPGILKISDNEFYVSGTTNGRDVLIYKSKDLNSFVYHNIYNPSGADTNYDYCHLWDPDFSLDSNGLINITFTAIRIANGGNCEEAQLINPNSNQTVYQARQDSVGVWAFSAPMELHYSVNGVDYGTKTNTPTGEPAFKLGPTIRENRIFYNWFDGVGNSISSVGLSIPHDKITHSVGGQYPEKIHEGGFYFQRNGFSYLGITRYDFRAQYTQSYMYSNAGAGSLVNNNNTNILDIANPIQSAGCAIGDQSCIYENAGNSDITTRNGQYYVVYHKMFPKTDPNNRHIYITPIYFKENGEIVSITKTKLAWNSAGSGMKYSLDVKPSGQDWIGPCVGDNIIGSNLSIEYDGLCQSAGDVVVHKGEVEKFRVCFTNNNWATAECREIANDVTKDELFIDASPLPTCNLSYSPTSTITGNTIVGTVSSTNAVSTTSWCGTYGSAMPDPSTFTGPAGLNGSWNVTSVTPTHTTCSIAVKNSAGSIGQCTASYEFTAIPINGVCGAAQGSYLATDTYWRDPVCDAGLPSPLLPWPFLAPGATMNWQCVGENGGTTASCSATRASNVIIPSAPSGLGVL
jgi:hypothetical protein